jgi:hypothetical protein
VARKSVYKPVDPITHEQMALIEIKAELAQEAYDFQDTETQALIRRLTERLRPLAAFPPGLPSKYMDMQLLFLATEILKDLALFDVKVGTYKFPPATCIRCGAEMHDPLKRGRKRGKRG